MSRAPHDFGQRWVVPSSEHAVQIRSDRDLPLPLVEAGGAFGASLGDFAADRTDHVGIDPIENVNVTWVETSKLPGFISIDQIYRPVREALELSECQVNT